jgi:hypothetical protein
MLNFVPELRASLLALSRLQQTERRLLVHLAPVSSSIPQPDLTIKHAHKRVGSPAPNLSGASRSLTPAKVKPKSPPSPQVRAQIIKPVNEYNCAHVWPSLFSSHSAGTHPTIASLLNICSFTRFGRVHALLMAFTWRSPSSMSLPR